MSKSEAGPGLCIQAGSGLGVRLGLTIQAGSGLAATSAASMTIQAGSGTKAKLG